MRGGKSNIDLINGPVFKCMILYSLPIILQGSFNIIYNLVDRYWVGWLPDGKEAIGSVSVGFSLFFFVMSLVFGISMGAGIMIAQYRGAQDKKMVNLIARNFIGFGILAIIVLAVVMVIATEPILMLLKTPADILPDGTAYMQWIFAGLPIFYVFNGLTGIFRGLGDSTTPLKVAAWSTIFNIVLDPIFILGPGPFPSLGVAGAAQATVLSNLLGAMILFPLLKKKHGDWVDLAPDGFRFDTKVISAILRLGLPTTASMVILSVSIMVIQRFVNVLGVDAVAAYGVCTTLDSLLMMPAQSFAQSMSTIAGQNIGAGKWERVDKFLASTLLVSGGTAIVVGLLLVQFSPWIAGFFLRDSADYDSVFPLIQIYVQIMLLRYLMMGLFFPINGTVRGAGDTMAAMWLVMFTQLIIRVPLTWLTQYLGYGFPGIAVGLSMSTVFGLIIMSIYYRTGRWKRFALVSGQQVCDVDETEEDIRPELI